MSDCLTKNVVTFDFGSIAMNYGINYFNVQNLQTMMAISHINREMLKNNSEPMDATRLQVLSLGTGSAKHEGKYDVDRASRWGLLNWMFDDGSTPLVDMFGDASSDMVDFHVSTLFHSLQVKDNYLRIQVLFGSSFTNYCTGRISN